MARWRVGEGLLARHHVVRTLSHIVAFGVSYGLASHHDAVAWSCFIVGATIAGIAANLNADFMRTMTGVPPIEVQHTVLQSHARRMKHARYHRLSGVSLRLTVVLGLASLIPIVFGFRITAALLTLATNICWFTAHLALRSATHTRANLSVLSD